MRFIISHFIDSGLVWASCNTGQWNRSFSPVQYFKLFPFNPAEDSKIWKFSSHPIRSWSGHDVCSIMSSILCKFQFTFIWKLSFLMLLMMISGLIGNLPLIMSHHTIYHDYLRCFFPMLGEFLSHLRLFCCAGFISERCGFTDPA